MLPGDPRDVRRYFAYSQVGTEMVAPIVAGLLLEATLIRRAATPCVLGRRKLNTPFSMRAAALSELTGTGSVIERCTTTGKLASKSGPLS